MTDWATYARAVNQAARALLALLPQSATDDASPPATPALRVAILAKASAVRSPSSSSHGSQYRLRKLPD
jgi:hypothetical protein